jgi:hypothetical protein
MVSKDTLGFLSLSGWWRSEQKANFSNDEQLRRNRGESFDDLRIVRSVVINEGEAVSHTAGLVSVVAP